MTMTRRIITGLLLAVSVAPLRGQESVALAPHLPPAPGSARVAMLERRLTLSEAVELAMDTNLEIDIERRTVASAMSGIGAAEGAFDPVIRFRPVWESATTPVSSILQASDRRLVNRNV